MSKIHKIDSSDGRYYPKLFCYSPKHKVMFFVSGYELHAYDVNSRMKKETFLPYKTEIDSIIIEENYDGNGNDALIMITNESNFCKMDVRRLLYGEGEDIWSHSRCIGFNSCNGFKDATLLMTPKHGPLIIFTHGKWYPRERRVVVFDPKTGILGKIVGIINDVYLKFECVLIDDFTIAVMITNHTVSLYYLDYNIQPKSTSSLVSLQKGKQILTPDNRILSHESCISFSFDRKCKTFIVLQNLYDTSCKNIERSLARQSWESVVSEYDMYGSLQRRVLLDVPCTTQGFIILCEGNNKLVMSHGDGIFELC